MALARVMGQSAMFSWIFLSGLLVVPFVTCAAGAFAARRLGGRFELTDGLLFGAAGGLLGGPLACWTGLTLAGARFTAGQTTRAAIEAAVPGLVAGLVVGACMGIGALWLRSRASE